MDLPKNWPKGWATKVWSVGGVQVLEDDLKYAYTQIAEGLPWRTPNERVRDRILGLLKRPGLIRYSGSQGRWVANANP